jgi:acyl-CoA synthetase (AMP-forming)/AMP-acid ligase II
MLDDHDRTVKPGVVGAIVMREPQMMARCWKLPEVTAQSLREGWLQTKVMASVDAAGYVDIVDRQDDLNMSGGFKLYPREVEAARSIHPAGWEVGCLLPQSAVTRYGVES